MTRQAVLAKRVDDGPAETTEIRGLAEAAGYDVVGEITQRRAEDAGTCFGGGKVDELARLVAETSAKAVVVDNDLSPKQSTALVDACPDGTRVADRHRVVLDIFAERAATRRAKLQVELASLEYELPRIEEEGDPHLMTLAAEKGTRLNDVRSRIDRVKRALDDIADDHAKRRSERHDRGFSLVAIAGYTNAGKSTLLHRLADDLSVDAVDPAHDDLDATASVENRLFETLQTTTRRGTLDGRRALLTDTVGLIDDLPHDLVESFHGTLSETYHADAVVLVVDASAPIDAFRDRVDTCRRVLDGNVDGTVVPALNKVDIADDDALDDRRDVLADRWSDPVAISALEGSGIDDLASTVAAELPAVRCELTVPNCDDAMSLVSWLYDRTSVETVDYASDEVSVAFTGRPEIVSLARGRADELR
ncbi:GTPase HflX [Halostella sp. PRR32]|uniref:GTPase HflX n=1 Tax=Halostella sp. PRR32 TaxID=3098147 RepID=UPI002B1E5A08|nr:GTPase HflX [Halostella sp. PRR32]